MVEFQLPKLSTRVRFPSLAPYVHDLRVRFFYKCLAVALVCMTAGCAATTELPTTAVTVPRGKGVYHKVRRGETIWRIAQAYQISIEEIIKSNRIPNVAKVEENQLLFIPGADAVKEIAVEKEYDDANEFVWPVKGKVLSYFGDRRGTQGSRGISIQTNAGDTVVAARDGEVIFADYLNGYADTVIVDHKDGYSTVYAQNASLLVKTGDLVKKRDPLAHVGSQKNDVSFLHFEVRKHSVADNPLYYLP